jgi:thioredoxin 2
MNDSTHVVCPQCQRTNRVPSAKLEAGPRCGGCHTPLFSQQPLPLGEAAFEAHLKNDDLPLVVDFWAPWCGPCRMMAPQFEAAARRLEPRVRLVKVNTDEAQQLSARYNIRSIPTLMIFRNGQEVARQAGAMSTDAILSWVKSNGLSG